MANTSRLGRRRARQRYVVGFAFNTNLTRVLLIEKTHGPENAEMTGMLNGLGGARCALERRGSTR